MISPSAFPGLRRQFDRLLSHRCTVTSVRAGAEDAHGDATPSPGDPVMDVPCLFTAAGNTTRGIDGVTLVSTPTLMASATGPVRVGVQISAVTDVLGGTPPGAAGVFKVESVKEDTAGLGAALVPTFNLQAADTELS